VTRLLAESSSFL